MKPTPALSPRPLPAAVRDLLVNLRIDDQRRHGNPFVPPGEVPALCRHLEQVCLDAALREAHLALLRELYRSPSTPARGSVFFHADLLPEERVQTVAERGLGVLGEEELARLALNPYALWDLADLIEETLPDAWLERMERRGQELLDELGIEPPEANPLPAHPLRLPVRMRSPAGDGWLLTEEEVARTYRERLGWRPAFRTALNMGAAPGRAADIADDAVQEAQARSIRPGQTYESREHYRNWLVRVAVRIVIDRMKAEYRSVQQSEGADVAGDPPGATFEDGELVRWCLERLSAEDRELLRRHDLEDETYASIAADLGLSTTCVFRKTREARWRSRQLLEAQLTGR